MMKTFRALLALSFIFAGSCELTNSSEPSDSVTSTEKSNNAKRQIDFQSVEQTTPPCSLSVYRYLYNLPGTQIRPHLPAGTVIFGKALPNTDNSLAGYNDAGSRKDAALPPAQQIASNPYQQSYIPQVPVLPQPSAPQLPPPYQPYILPPQSRVPPTAYSQTLLPKVAPYAANAPGPLAPKAPTYVSSPLAPKLPVYSPFTGTSSAPRASSHALFTPAPLAPKVSAFPQVAPVPLAPKLSQAVSTFSKTPAYASQVSKTPSPKLSIDEQSGSRIDAAEPIKPDENGNGQSPSSTSSDNKLGYLPPGNNYLPPPPNPTINAQSVPPVKKQGDYFIPIGAFGVTPTPNPDIVSPGSPTATDDAVIVPSTPGPDASGEGDSSTVTPGYPPFSSTEEPDFSGIISSTPDGFYPSPTPSPGYPIFSPSPSPGQPIYYPTPSPDLPIFSPSPSPEVPAFSPSPSPDYPIFSPTPGPPTIGGYPEYPEYSEQEIFQPGGGYPVGVGGTRCTCEDGQVFFSPSQNYPFRFKGQNLRKNIGSVQSEVVVSSTPRPASGLRPIVVENLSHKINLYSIGKPFVPASSSTVAPLPSVISSTPTPLPVISSTLEPAPVEVSSTPAPRPIIFSSSIPVPSPDFVSSTAHPPFPDYFSAPTSEISPVTPCVPHISPSPYVVHSSGPSVPVITSTPEPEFHINFEAARVLPKAQVPIIPNLRFPLPALPPKAVFPFAPTYVSQPLLPQPLPQQPFIVKQPLPPPPAVSISQPVLRIPSPAPSPISISGYVYSQPPPVSITPAPIKPLHHGYQYPVPAIPFPPPTEGPIAPSLELTTQPSVPSPPDSGYQYPVPAIPFPPPNEVSIAPPPEPTTQPPAPSALESGYQYPVPPSTEAPVPPSPEPTTEPPAPPAPEGGYQYPKPSVPFPLPSESGNESGYSYPKPSIPFSLPEKFTGNDNSLGQ